MKCALPRARCPWDENSKLKGAIASEASDSKTLRYQIDLTLWSELLLCGAVGPLMPDFRVLLLLDLDTDGMIQSGLQLRSITEEEEYLHPDEERSQEQGLYQIIQQCRRSPLKHTMSDKLCDPAEDVQSNRPFVGR